MHSTRSRVRDLPIPTDTSSGALLGGGQQRAAGGVWVDCYSPEQSKLGPQSGLGKQGELKRWRQFLIRGNPKRGKRSFRRAQKRADLHGQTVYKGRVIYGRGQQTVQPTARTPDRLAKECTVPRRRVFSWNAGGLCGETKVEFEYLLHNSLEADIVLLQETHWSSSGSWKQSGWTYFHSASERSRQAGVMIGVRSELLDDASAAWKEIVPGRLLWVRACIQGQQWDLLNLYQVAQAGKDGETKAYRLKERQAIWNKLQKVLRGLPMRSMVLLGGDFNLGLEPFRPVTGCGLMPTSLDRDAREERFRVLELLQEAQMTVLNTWSKARPTYLHPTGSTQIDFLAVRRRNADKVSKMAQPEDMGLSGWRSCGHRPVTASLRAHWRPWCRRVVKTQSDVMDTPQGEEALANLRSQVKLRCSGARRRLEPMVLRPLDAQVARHWEARRKLQTMPVAGGSLREFFNFFRAACGVQKLHRELKKHCRLRKREQLLSHLEMAEAAFQRGDSRAFFGFVRIASPKPFLPQIKLRGKEGQLLTQAQEGQLLLGHVKKIFAGDSTHIPDLAPLSPDIFAVERWEEALHEIKPNKAVPRGEAQILAWKCDISGIATKLSELSISFLCSDRPWVPQLWCKIQIAWLPKPKKAPCLPEHLRTVGLMSGDSKAFMTLLKNAARDVVHQSIQQYPQFAYRSGASTTDAILRVTSHCYAVRGVLERTHTSKAARLMGESVPNLKGGLMVAIDLAKAFDNVTYQEMFLALREAGMEEALVQLIVQVHMNTRCSVVYGSFQGSTGMSKGLRQGCPIAPLVYLAWSVRFLKQVNKKLGDRWDQRHATVYADDKHLAWEIDGMDSLRKALRELGAVIETFQETGMEVSFGKCEAVLQLKGLQQDKAMKKFTKARNGVAHLIFGKGGSMLIPLKNEIAYLGARLSYGSFEYCTAQHRCKQSWRSFNSLRKALRTSSVLSSKERLRIYRVCIWPVVEYGLIGTGVDSRSLKLIESTVAQQLRKVLRVHEKGVSNTQVFEQAGLIPRDILCTRFSDQFSRLASALAPSILVDLAQRALQVRDFFQRIIQTDSGALVPVSLDTGCPCPVCGVYFDSAAGVALHIQRRHADVHRDSKISFDRAKHCVDGLPQCVFCLNVLGDMQALEKHIAAGGCFVLKQAIAADRDIEALRLQLCADRSVTTQSSGVATNGPDLGVPVPDPLHFLTHPPHIIVRDYAASILARSPCCLLCGQRMLDVRRTKTHWRAIHTLEWSRHSAAAGQLCRTLSKAVRRPCQFCGSSAKESSGHAPQCAMLFQAMLLHEIRRSPAQTDATTTERPTLPRRSEQVAVYKSFCLSNTPIGVAFRKGTGDGIFGSKETGERGPRTCGSDVSHNGAADLVRFTKQSRLGQFFRAAVQAPAGENEVAGLWTLRLRLQNPHSLCYLNAGVLSLVHFLEVVGSAEYSALSRLCQQAEQADRPLLLSQQLVVRSLFSGWRFTSVQRDCAELMMQAVSLRGDYWAEWEQGENTGPRRETGGCPLLFPLPSGEAVSLQALAGLWSRDGAGRHLTARRPVLVQLGRSTEHGKSHALVDFGEPVHLPVRSGGVEMSCAYIAVSGVVHIGAGVTSGHYRALLLQGSQWYFADDGIMAARTLVSDHIRSNIYMLWLQPLVGAVGLHSLAAAQ